eukprot:g4192.t1
MLTRTHECFGCAVINAEPAEVSRLEHDYHSKCEGCGSEYCENCYAQYCLPQFVHQDALLGNMGSEVRLLHVDGASFTKPKRSCCKCTAKQLGSCAEEREELFVWGLNFGLTLLPDEQKHALTKFLTTDSQKALIAWAMLFFWYSQSFVPWVARMVPGNPQAHFQQPPGHHDAPPAPVAICNVLQIGELRRQNYRELQLSEDQYRRLAGERCLDFVAYLHGAFEDQGHLTPRSGDTKTKTNFLAAMVKQGETSSESELVKKWVREWFQEKLPRGKEDYRDQLQSDAIQNEYEGARPDDRWSGHNGLEQDELAQMMAMVYKMEHEEKKKQELQQAAGAGGGAGSAGAAPGAQTAGQQGHDQGEQGPNEMDFGDPAFLEEQRRIAEQIERQNREEAEWRRQREREQEEERAREEEEWQRQRPDGEEEEWREDSEETSGEGEPEYFLEGKGKTGKGSGKGNNKGRGGFFSGKGWSTWWESDTSSSVEPSASRAVNHGIGPGDERQMEAPEEERPALVQNNATPAAPTAKARLGLAGAVSRLTRTGVLPATAGTPTSRTCVCIIFCCGII